MAYKLPHVDQSLIEYLERSNPDRHPVNFSSPFDLGKEAGKIELIRHLRRLYEDQVKASLAGSLLGE